MLATDTAFSTRDAHDLGRVDDPGLDQIHVGLAGGVEAVVAASPAHLVDDHAAVGRRVLGELPGRRLEGPSQDLKARALVALGVDLLALDRLDGPEQRQSPAGDDSLRHRGLRGADRVVEGLLLALHLGLGRRPHAHDGDAAGELGEPLLELFLVVLARGLVDFLPDLLLAPLDGLLVAGAADDGRAVLVDDDPRRVAELLDLEALELDPELLGEDLPAREDRDVLQHGLAPVAVAGGLHGHALERAADLVHDERGERLALDVLGDEEDGLPGARHLLEDRQEILHDGDLPVGQEHPHVLEHGFHLLGVGDEVRREEAAVELQAFDDLELRLGGLRLLHGDDALVADLLHGVGDQVADRGVVVSGDGRDLGLLESAVDGPGQRPERCHHRADAAVEPALQVDGAGARDHVADAVGEDRLGEDRRGARAVAHGVAGALGGLPHHLRAEVLDGILEVHLLGDGDAVIADERRAVLLLDEHGLGLGTERDPHRIGQRVHALEHLFAGVGPEQHLLVRHDVTSLHEIDAGHPLYDSASSGSVSATRGATPDHRDFTVLWPVRLPAAGIGAPHWGAPAPSACRQTVRCVEFGSWSTGSLWHFGCTIEACGDKGVQCL